MFLSLQHIALKVSSKIVQLLLQGFLSQLEPQFRISLSRTWFLKTSSSANRRGTKKVND